MVFVFTICSYTWARLFGTLLCCLYCRQRQSRVVSLDIANIDTYMPRPFRECARLFVQRCCYICHVRSKFAVLSPRFSNPVLFQRRWAPREPSTAHHLAPPKGINPTQPNFFGGIYTLLSSHLLALTRRGHRSKNNGRNSLGVSFSSPGKNLNPASSSSNTYRSCSPPFFSVVPISSQSRSPAGSSSWRGA